MTRPDNTLAWENTHDLFGGIFGSVCAAIDQLRASQRGQDLDDDRLTIDVANKLGIYLTTVRNVLIINRLSEALCDSPCLADVANGDRIKEHSKELANRMDVLLLAARDSALLSASEIAMVGLYLRLDPSMAGLQNLSIGTSPAIYYRKLYEYTKRRHTKESLSSFFGMRLDLFEEAYANALIRLRQQEV